MKVLDLFSGIGGFSLGLELAGMQTVAFCEVDPFCRAVLAKHWPGVPCHDDITTLDGKPFRGKVDLVCGGVPCQPASVAGKRKGSSDDRWIWPAFLRIVRQVQPVWVLAENVPGLVTLQPHGLDWVCDELEASGYECETIVVGAEHVGSTHKRKRVFLVVHADPSRLEGEEWKRIYCEEKGEGKRGAHNQSVRSVPRDWPPRPGAVGEIPTMADGLPGRLAMRHQKLGAIGNAVVPQVVEAIGRAIIAVEQQKMKG